MDNFYEIFKMSDLELFQELSEDFPVENEEDPEKEVEVNNNDSKNTDNDRTLEETDEAPREKTKTMIELKK